MLRDAILKDGTHAVIGELSKDKKYYTTPTGCIRVHKVRRVLPCRNNVFSSELCSLRFKLRSTTKKEINYERINTNNSRGSNRGPH